MSQSRIRAINHAELSSKQIADMLGYTERYVRKVRQRLDLPRPGRGAQVGDKNHQFVAGRRIDFDGYALVSAPYDHPHARNRPNRRTKLIFEHRMVMEKILGRYLQPQEVVDHIDGLTLHNAPNNLRLFASNGDHLRATISGMPHRVSAAGLASISARHQGAICSPVDIYRLRKVRGDVRLRQILLAALILGTNSPFLSGTHRHLGKAQIDIGSRSSLEQAWADLSARWESDLAQ